MKERTRKLELYGSGFIAETAYTVFLFYREGLDGGKNGKVGLIRVLATAIGICSNFTGKR